KAWITKVFTRIATARATRIRNGVEPMNRRHADSPTRSSSSCSGSSRVGAPGLPSWPPRSASGSRSVSLAACSGGVGSEVRRATVSGWSRASSCADSISGMVVKDTCSIPLRREQLDLDSLEGGPDLDAGAQAQPFDRAQGDLGDERRCGREPY